MPPLLANTSLYSVPGPFPSTDLGLPQVASQPPSFASLQPMASNTSFISEPVFSSSQNYPVSQAYTTPAGDQVLPFRPNVALQAPPAPPPVLSGPSTLTQASSLPTTGNAPRMVSVPSDWLLAQLSQAYGLPQAPTVPPSSQTTGISNNATTLPADSPFPPDAIEPLSETVFEPEAPDAPLDTDLPESSQSKAADKGLLAKLKGSFHALKEKLPFPGRQTSKESVDKTASLMEDTHSAKTSSKSPGNLDSDITKATSDTASTGHYKTPLLSSHSSNAALSQELGDLAYQLSDRYLTFRPHDRALLEKASRVGQQLLDNPETVQAKVHTYYRELGPLRKVADWIVKRIIRKLPVDTEYTDHLLDRRSARTLWSWITKKPVSDSDSAATSKTVHKQHKSHFLKR